MRYKFTINWRRIALFLAVAPPFMGLTSGMFNAVMMVVALGIIYVTERRILLPKAFLEWASLFATFALASYLWAENTTTVVMTTLSYIQVVILALDIILASKSDEDLDYVIGCMIFGAVVYIIQRVLKTPMSQLLSMGRIGGGNSVTIRFTTAAVLIFSRRKRYRHKLLMWMTILLLCFFAFLQGSRKGIVIIVVGFVAILFWEAKFKHNIASYMKTVIGILAVGVIVYFAIMKIPALYQSIGVRVENTLAFFSSGEAVDSSTRTRNLLIKEAIRIWKEHPVLGIGQDAFRYVNKARYDYYAHNNYYEILANLGLIGLVLYYSIFAISFFRVSKTLWKKEEACLVPAFTVLFLTLVTDYMKVSYSTESTYVFIGFAFALLYLYNNGVYGKKGDERKNEVNV